MKPNRRAALFDWFIGALWVYNFILILQTTGPMLDQFKIQMFVLTVILVARTLYTGLRSWNAKK